jgi:predicted TIM-barrel enzyme
MQVNGFCPLNGQRNTPIPAGAGILLALMAAIVTGLIGNWPSFRSIISCVHHSPAAQRYVQENITCAGSGGPARRYNRVQFWRL